ncbi:MAG: Calcium/sodium antiporter [Patescibacteria group bacterium]|jgi:cation:H+ antiporter|nr:Calcium/sodium antiporter [Patescibacteria group bacterium]
MIIVYVLIFIASLFVLVKGADLFLNSSEKVGLAAGLSPFVVGVVIVGVGTSFPELISSLVAVIEGVPEIVTANAVGSNIANILVIIGISAIVARKIKSKTNLTDLEIPMMAIITLIFLALAYDGNISKFDSVTLIASFLIYLAYSLFNKPDESTEKTERPKISTKDFILLVLGLVGLVFGSKYLIDSVVSISEILNIAPGVISVVAVAFGTSLPELLVSVKAAIKGSPEVAIGNVFGSNAFNLMMVVGLPGLFKTLPLDPVTLGLALPALLIVTFVFIISCLSNIIHKWEGFMYLILYIIFIGKVFGFL